MSVRPLLALACACLPAMAHGACSVAASGVAFGAYDPTSATATTFNGTVTVTCTGGSGLGGYSVSLSTGTEGSYAGRRMILSTSPLPYQLYREAGRTTIWGDGTGGSMVINGSDLIPLLGGTTVFQVYGRIAARLPATPGSYLDSITATLTY
jgi:spore coat protein U-like protein